MSDKPSIFAGMTTEQLQAYLASAQHAYIELSSGKRVATVAYAQGDGSKSVSFQAAELGALMQLIRMLQMELGIVPRARRAIGVQF